ncbi:MAG: hypothetical protein KF862_02325 [Chitinophagaceae bacterium]|nr:hypothetical protein [Chitinophagaceae bacterium]
MKIRIKGDSVRLRLTQTDIRNLGQQGYVQEQTHFANAIFGYCLRRSNTAGDIYADFSDGKITVFIPDDFVKTLVETDRVGYDAVQSINHGSKLFILVEKDFQCLDHTLEDQSDMYLNPNKTC